MAKSRDISGRRVATLAVVLSFWALVAALFQSPANADVTSVRGSAYGYFGNVGLFGGPPSPRGPVPTVTLPPSGSAAPITASAPTGLVQYGPGIVFTSGPITVTTQGTTGPTGSVTSTATIQTIDASGQDVFTATNLSSTCTASESGVTGSTTIVNGTLQTSDGDPNVVGDETIVVLDPNPAPNTTYTGVINSVGDRFRYVFNEQIVNPDGSLTVNAVHQYLLGPTAVGELIIGQVVCGVTAVPASTTTTSTTLPVCQPGKDGAKPGNGNGDKNHVHCGPPGQTGIKPVSALEEQRNRKSR